MNLAQARLVSAKVFGNEKVPEVIQALAAEGHTATAQQIAKRTQIDHSMVRDVLVRLADAGILTRIPRASARAPQYYEAQKDDQIWVVLVRLAAAILSGGGEDLTTPASQHSQQL